jgi:hypothetical protein
LKNEGVFLQTSISNFFAKKKEKVENWRSSKKRGRDRGWETKEMKSKPGNE